KLNDPIARVIDLAARCAARGWTPATAGNFSVRIDAGRVAITRSGADKGSLTPADILTLPLAEPPPREASAEAPIHWTLYHRMAEVGAVAHAHPPSTTVLSMMSDARHGLSLEGLELLKVLPGQSTHETRITVPVLPNTQDMTGLAAKLDWNPSAPALILSGHGIYCWGRDEDAAFRHMEALEYMFDLEFRRRQIAK
ncbi:MAG: methylthioribulose 1-phosphate dehydratase, partial [Alphaproteobacteria bacterium]